MLRKVVMSASNSFVKCICSTKALLTAMLSLLVIAQQCISINAYCVGIQTRINPLLFPFLDGNMITHFVLMSALVFMLSDAPFRDEQHPFLVLRTGKTAWLLGQILFIAGICAAYYIFLSLVMFVFVLPCMTFATDGWGKAVWSAARDKHLAGQWEVLLFNTKVASAFSPWQAAGLSIGLNAVCGLFLGLVIFATNMCMRRNLGSFVALAIVLMDMFVYNMGLDKFFMFSPASLSRLALIDPSGAGISSSPLWAFGYMGALAAGMIALLFVEVNSQNVEII